MGSTGGNSSLQPTWDGFVGSTGDALILFEACLQGQLPHVPRRPHDRERNSLIRSGSIFIYEENASGIKRWTDGVAWSPSRILGNFLIYRELMKPFPPGEKKRATKRAKRPTRPGEPYPRTEADDGSNDNSPTSPPTAPSTPMTRQSVPGPATTPGENTELERQLIGSLVDSYGFKTDGLVKKTMSVTVNGVHHHLVSYYKVDDVINQRLERPSTAQRSRLRSIIPRPELVLRQNFRSPMEESEDGLHHQMDHRRNPAALQYYADRRSDMYMAQPMYYTQQAAMAQQPFYAAIPSPGAGSPYAAQQQYSASQGYTMTAMSAPNNPYMAQPSVSSQLGAEAYQAYGAAPYGASLDTANRAVPSAPTPQTQHPQQQQHPQHQHSQSLQYPAHLVKVENSAIPQNAAANLALRENYYSPPAMSHQPGYAAVNARWPPHSQPDTPVSYQHSRPWSQPEGVHDGLERGQHPAQLTGWGAGT